MMAPDKNERRKELWKRREEVRNEIASLELDLSYAYDDLEEIDVELYGLERGE